MLARTILQINFSCRYWDNMQRNQAVLQGNWVTDLYECENRSTISIDSRRRLKSWFGLWKYWCFLCAGKELRSKSRNSLSRFTLENRAVSEGQSERNADRTVAQLSESYSWWSWWRFRWSAVTIRRIGDFAKGSQNFWWILSRTRQNIGKHLHRVVYPNGRNHVVHWKPGTFSLLNDKINVGSLGTAFLFS